MSKDSAKHSAIFHSIAGHAGDDDWDQSHGDEDYDDGLAVEEDKPKLKPPRQYKVMVMNDDYTPMEFVVQVLMTFFAMDNAKATRVMMSVHTKGRGICGTFSHEIAETKVDQVNEFSRINQHPLMCTMEEA
ncbi:MAG: ATP-dependent Clp protease adapter ClpS [Proteobacteria bacterium]|nr:ATP-dependent Clp protease adapter ClpS [Pseudomonadota bacterium]